jgi:two-component system, NarL family, response regulator
VPTPSTPRPVLTSRQRAVLELAAQGLSNRQIGEQLEIAEQTVKNHLFIAMRKLAIHDRTQAVIVAIGRGLIAIPVDGGAAIESASGLQADAEPF